MPEGCYCRRSLSRQSGSETYEGGRGFLFSRAQTKDHFPRSFSSLAQGHRRSRAWEQTMTAQRKRSRASGRSRQCPLLNLLRESSVRLLAAGLGYVLQLVSPVAEPSRFQPHTGMNLKGPQEQRGQWETVEM